MQFDPEDSSCDKNVESPRAFKKATIQIQALNLPLISFK